MRTLDVVAAALVIVGGINWGLVGLLGFDLVAALFGEMSSLSRAVYALVGVAALYQAMSFRGIQARWGEEATAGA